MHRVGHKRSGAVAKLPVPSLGRTHIYQRAGGKLGGVAVASCHRGKVNRWRSRYHHLPGGCVAAASGDGDNQHNRVVACGSVYV